MQLALNLVFGNGTQVECRCPCTEKSIQKRCDCAGEVIIASGNSVKTTLGVEG
jgi:hypothetical protein